MFLFNGRDKFVVKIKNCKLHFSSLGVGQETRFTHDAYSIICRIKKKPAPSRPILDAADFREMLE